MPKVKVVSEQVEALKTDGPLKPESQAETAVVATMLVLFTAIIVEGLVLAGSVRTRVFVKPLNFRISPPKYT